MSDVANMTDAELRAELVEWLRGKKAPQTWRWIRHGERRITGVKVQADGSASAEGVTEREAREAAVSAYRRLHERRSKSATKAAATRAERQARRVYFVAERIVGGRAFGPRITCCICSRRLDDAESIKRGIGSECWQGVLSALTRQAEAGV